MEKVHTPPTLPPLLLLWLAAIVALRCCTVCAEQSRAERRTEHTAERTTEQSRASEGWLASKVQRNFWWLKLWESILFPGSVSSCDRSSQTME